MAYAASVIADSISEAGDRLTTMEVTFPRLILAEFNTHRMFSRNSASSRAIPAEKQLERIMNDPFVPAYWGANQSGMQAEHELTAKAQADAEREWFAARDSAVAHAKHLLAIGLHKQLTNRLLEPFMWQTVIVTATEWDNFYALRANKDAQPEIRTIAEMMRDVQAASTPRLIKAGKWHLPLIQPDEYDGRFEYTLEARQVSAARCARVSYLTHAGVRDHAADMKLYERLVSGGHMSPLEHVATPLYIERDKVAFSSDDGFEFGSIRREPSSEFVGNFRGWKQLRKFMPHEDDFSLVSAS